MADPDAPARILSAADRLFGLRGFDGTSVRDVAEEAGVTKALVFYYYESKDALLDAVLEEYYRAHADSLEASFEGGGTLRERLHRVVDAYLDFVDENRRYPRLVQHELTRAGGRIDRIRTSLTSIGRWFETALAEELPSDGPLAPRQFFLTLAAASLHLYTYAPALRPLFGRDPLSKRSLRERREHIHWLVDALLDGLERA